MEDKYLKLLEQKRENARLDLESIKLDCYNLEEYRLKLKKKIELKTQIATYIDCIETYKQNQNELQNLDRFNKKIIIEQEKMIKFLEKKLKKYEGNLEIEKVEKQETKYNFPMDCGAMQEKIIEMVRQKYLKETYELLKELENEKIKNV